MTRNSTISAQEAAQLAQSATCGDDFAAYDLFTAVRQLATLIYPDRPDIAEATAVTALWLAGKAQGKRDAIHAQIAVRAGR